MADGQRTVDPLDVKLICFAQLSSDALLSFESYAAIYSDSVRDDALDNSSGCTKQLKAHHSILRPGSSCHTSPIMAK